MLNKGAYTGPFPAKQWAGMEVTHGHETSWLPFRTYLQGAMRGYLEVVKGHIPPILAHKHRSISVYIDVLSLNFCGYECVQNPSEVSAQSNRYPDMKSKAVVR